MQMYSVDYTTHFEHAIEVGSVVVCATDHDAAGVMVMHELNLPTSRTRVETTRVKPSIFRLASKQIAKPNGHQRRNPVHNSRREPTELIKYHFEISGNVLAPDEKSALRRLAESVDNKGNRKGTANHTSHLVIDCKEASDYQRRAKGLEAIEIYRQRPGVQGGDATDK